MNFKEVTNRWPGDVTPMNQAGDIFQMEGQKTSFFFFGGGRQEFTDIMMCLT